MVDMDVKAYILTSTRNSSGGPPQGWGKPSPYSGRRRLRPE
jgi:hypothetical protein